MITTLFLKQSIFIPNIINFSSWMIGDYAKIQGNANITGKSKGD